MKKLSILLYSVILISTTSNVFALEFCVNNSTGLQNALAFAAANNQDDVIKIAAGEFDSPTGGFEYNGASEAFDLVISGGWTEFFGNPCGQQLVGAFESRINGNNTEVGISIFANDASLVSITRMVFFRCNAKFSSGGALLISDGQLFLEHNSFITNFSDFGGAALWFSSNGFSHVIRNNLFLNNHSSISAGAIDIKIDNGSNGVYFTNNTVISNGSGTKATDVSTGLNLRTFGTADAYVGNNIFWFNQYHGLELFGNGFKYLRHNDIDAQTGMAADNEFGNMSVDPQFVGSKGDYSLKPSSPLIDQGIKPNQATNDFANNWLLGNFDLVGGMREQGNKVDIGAIELTPETPIFMNGFE